MSGKVFNESKHFADKNQRALPYLDYINSIVENAVLLDSYAIPENKAKSPNSVMMHSLYAIADMGKGKELVKLYIEEINDVNSDGTMKRAYQLQNIENQQSGVIGSGNIPSQITQTADVNTVSQKSETVNTHSMQNGKKYAVSDSYSRKIDEWYKSGKSNNESFALGSTGDALQGLGAIESDIYMNSDKINRILDKHKEITVAEIKKIPEILEDPVFILKSQNKDRGGKQNTRLIIFGSVKGQDGRPVLSVLDLRPVENNFAINDMQKVSSVYTKDNNPVAFIENSDVVYADKKRTANLLHSIGFQMPTELRQSGYIGSISYIKRSVNIQGEKFSDVFDTAANTYSTQTDEKYAVPDEESGDDRWKKIEDAERGLKSADETVRSLKRRATNIGRS